MHRPGIKPSEQRPKNFGVEGDESSRGVTASEDHMSKYSNRGRSEHSRIATASVPDCMKPGQGETPFHGGFCPVVSEMFVQGHLPAAN